MTIDEVTWSKDAIYALGTIKRITWIAGTWPLQEGGIFARIRFGIVLALGLGVIVSLLMEIRLRCGTADENMDFIGLLVSTLASLTKVIVLKVRREDFGKILTSALRDWCIVDSKTKDTMRKYARRAKLVYRLQLGFSFIIVIAMILDALPESSESPTSSSNLTSSMELVRHIPLRTMCTFGDMSTSIYWAVFSLQGFQLLNAVIIDAGHDSFYFGVSMYICGQFDVLTSLSNELIVNGQDNDAVRDRKIEEFIDRHSFLLDLARRLRNTLDIVLLLLLMSDGLHICLLGIQVIINSKDNDVIPLVKSTLAFFFILEQVFLYSYVGDYISSLSQNIQEIVYECPWYEFPPNVVRNLMFVMARAHVPLHITAGRFYVLNIDSFKDILKASFSYFSVLRIMFEE